MDALAEEVEHGGGEELEGVLARLERDAALGEGAGLGEVLDGEVVEVPMTEKKWWWCLFVCVVGGQVDGSEDVGWGMLGDR